MVATLYGPIVTGDHVRAAVISTLKRWCDPYVHEMGRQLGLNLEPMRVFQTFGFIPSTATTPGTYPLDRQPGVIVTAPGTLAIERQGSGAFNAIWGVGVGVVLSDKTKELSIRAAEGYGAALMALLVQQGDLGGFALETTWTDIETHEIAWELDRSTAACTLMFEVVVENVLNRWDGPLTAPVDPSLAQQMGTAATVDPQLFRMRPP